MQDRHNSNETSDEKKEKKKKKGVIMLTDRPAMTLDVYRGRKTTMQQYCYLLTINLSINRD